MSLVAVRKIRDDVYFDERTGNIYYSAVEDITDIVNDNLVAQQDEGNGFTPDRTMRQIASIPLSIMHKLAKETGYYSMNAEDKRRALDTFLAKEQQYMTVDKMKHNTAHQGNIIVK
jgi:hypothetical protein